MAAWVVRGGRRGEYEQTFMSEDIVGIDWRLGQSAIGFGSRDVLRDYLIEAGQASNARVAGNFAGQIWNFVHAIRNGDLIVLPRKLTRVIAVGRVSGDYEYRPHSEPAHIRPVNWMAHEIPAPISIRICSFPLEDFRPSFVLERVKPNCA